jgi:hypothetical protein
MMMQQRSRRWVPHLRNKVCATNEAGLHTRAYVQRLFPQSTLTASLLMHVTMVQYSRVLNTQVDA